MPSPSSYVGGRGGGRIVNPRRANRHARSDLDPAINSCRDYARPPGPHQAGGSERDFRSRAHSKVDEYHPNSFIYQTVQSGVHVSVHMSRAISRLPILSLHVPRFHRT